MSTILASGHSLLSTTRGEALTWCATLSGSYAALTGWVLIIDRTPAPISNDETQAGEIPQTATLKGPVTPVMVRGYFITDGNGEKWSVEGVKLEQQQVCTLMRTKVTIRAPDRGNFS